MQGAGDWPPRGLGAGGGSWGSGWAERHGLFVVAAAVGAMWALSSAVQCAARSRCRLRRRVRERVAAHVVRTAVQLPLCVIFPPQAHALLYGDTPDQQAVVTLRIALLLCTALCLFELCARRFAPVPAVSCLAGAGGAVFLLDFLPEDEHACQRLAVIALLGGITGWVFSAVQVLYQVSKTDSQPRWWLPAVLGCASAFALFVAFLELAWWAVCYARWHSDIHRSEYRVLWPLALAALLLSPLHCAFVHWRIRRGVVERLGAGREAARLLRSSSACVTARAGGSTDDTDIGRTTTPGLCARLGQGPVVIDVLGDRDGASSDSLLPDDSAVWEPGGNRANGGAGRVPCP